MRFLLIDAGNSRLKWALYESGQLSLQGSLAYAWPSLAAQLDEVLEALAATTGPIAGVLLCNVAGDKLEVALREKLNIHWPEIHQDQAAVSPAIEKVVAQADAFGVRNAYRQPAQLGADRWAGLVAARQHCAGLTCIIDCGTAVTVDVITTEGRHAGGIIIPGMEMMMASLIENTDGILAGTRTAVSPLATTNTAEAVQAGVMAAMSGAVQQVLQDCRNEFGEEAACVLTGGNAEQLLSSLPAATIYDPDWVFKGMAIIAVGNESLSVGTGNQN